MANVGVRIRMSFSRRDKNIDSTSYHDDPTYLDQLNTKNRLLSRLALIIFGVVATFFIQNTLAANISLNSGARVEFGQGIQMTTACSGATQLTMIPNETFTNVSGAGSFKFSSITISNIAISCQGSDFTINAYDNSGNTPLAIFNSTSTSAVIFDDSGTFRTGVGSAGMSVTSGSGSFTATFTSPVALASAVSKISLQSGVSSGSVYVVGDTGPGGGTIFYVASSPFACGPTRSTTCTYLEAAPSGWNIGTDPIRKWATTPYQSTAVNNASSPETATATAVGWGYRNTRAIILQGNSDTAISAAALADAYTVSISGVAFDDWFLPSKDELNQMCKWQRGITGANLTTLTTVCTGGALNSGTGSAGFIAFDYWSSSQIDADKAQSQYFGVGSSNYYPWKYADYYVRPVRAF